MPSRLPRYLKTYRLKSGFTQDEIAILAGLSQGSEYSRFENGVRQPAVDMLIALTVILDAPMDELFPALHEEVEACVIARAEQMHRELQGTSGSKTELKLNTLERILARDPRTKL